MQTDRTLARIHGELCDMLYMYMPRSCLAFLDKVGLQRLHLPIIQVCHRPGQWLRWDPPSYGTFKLNTDGSSIDGKCAGGGIIRDCYGSCIAAFSNFYGLGSNMFAEIREPYGMVFSYVDLSRYLLW